MSTPTLAVSGPLPPTPVVTLHDVELAAVGFWNAATGPTLLTEAEMQSMVAAANDPEVDQAPAHPGHFDPRFPRMADGEPALGWVKPKRVFGGKLIGDLVDVPAGLAGPMLKAFSRRSVEFARNVITPSGRFYPAALTGLGMLGLQAPAVKGLADVAARYVYAGAAIPAGAPEIVALEVSDTPQVRYGVAALVALAGHDGAQLLQEVRPMAKFSDTTVRELLGLAENADVTAIQAQIAAGAQTVQVPAGTPTAPAPVVAPASPTQVVPGQQVAVMPDGTVVPIPGTAPAAPAAAPTGAAPAPAQLAPGQQPPAAAPPAVPVPQQVAASALPIAPAGWAYNAQLQLVPAAPQAPTFPAAPAAPAPAPQHFAAAPAAPAAQQYALDPTTGHYVPVPPPAAPPGLPAAPVAGGNPLVTTLSSGVLTELQTRAVRGDVAMGMLEEQQREGILNQALQEGRLAVAEVPTWRENLRTNLTGTWQLLQSLAPNRVPVGAIGSPAALSAGSPAANQAADEAFAAWERATFPDIAAAHAAATA